MNIDSESDSPTEREKFEEWTKRVCSFSDERYKFVSEHNYYFDDSLQDCWESWQACAELK